MSLDKIKNAMLSNFSFYKWYSAFSSSGNIIASILDMTDGKWDGTICIPIKTK